MRRTEVVAVAGFGGVEGFGGEGEGFEGGGIVGVVAPTTILFLPGVSSSPNCTSPRPPPSSGSESGSKRSRDTTEDGEEQQSPIRPIGRDAAKRNRGKKVARKMDGEFEDCSARESESRGSFEQMTALRIKQIELDMAKTAQKRDDKRMEVLMALLNKQTLTSTEEETKERLLKLL